MGEEVRSTAADGGTFAAHLALLARTPAPGLIGLPEIFDSNARILTWEINLVRDMATDDDHRFRVIADRAAGRSPAMPSCSLLRARA